MKVVSVINYKGGVGKTTLVSNLAAYAASHGKRVLMIDLDPQMSLTLSFMTMQKWEKKYEKKQTLKNFFDTIRKNKQPSLSKLIIHVPDIFPALDELELDLISSNLELIDVDVTLSAAISGSNDEISAGNFLRCYNHLKLALHELEDNYDLVLIDCPPNFYALVKNAITASDYYIVPSKLDYLSKLGVDHLDKSVKKYVKEYKGKREVYIKNNPDDDAEYQEVTADILGVVPTMVEIWQGKRLKATCSRFYRHLQEKKYYLFQWIRDNSNFFGVDPVAAGPAVLRDPNEATEAHEKIIEELEALGQEFLERTGI